MTNEAPSPGFGGQSLTVELRRGDTLRQPSIPVPDDDRAGGQELNQILDRALDDTFMYLGFVDPYGDTIFSRIQMEAVIPELERLQAAAHTEIERQVMNRVVLLARRCAETVHSFLVFVGD